MLDWESVLYRGLSLVVAAVTLVVWVACGDDSAPEPSGSPITSPTASVQGGDLGPLAVLDTLGGSDARGGTGPIRIDQSCVIMTVENGNVLLLVWHAAEVTWDGVSREITFSSVANPGPEPIILRDGDVITVGGESLEGDVPVERELTWLATPDPACRGAQWAVSSVVKQ